ncbi:MAG: hypothetical protein IPI67_40260 [Myxococcales bacterium]|nr:hypothetical protein [Myxococcales bacterium]
MALRSALGLMLAGLCLLPAPCDAAEPDNAACLRSYEAAQRLRLARKLQASRVELRSCAASSCPGVLAADCRRWLGEVERAQPTFVVVARAGGQQIDDVEVRVDDEVVADKLDPAAIAVDPGSHELRFDVAGRPPILRRLVFAEGEKERKVEVDFGGNADPETPGRRNLVPVYGLAALGAIGIGSFVFFGVRSHSRRADLESCRGHCPDDRVDRVRTDQLVADVSLGVGLVALGAAGYFYFSSDKPDSERTAVRVGAAPTPGGGRAVLLGSF